MGANSDTPTAATFSMYVVYRDPSDHPGRWIIRRWGIGRGLAEPAEIVGDHGEAIDAYGQLRRLGLTLLDRHPDDDPVIDSVWL